MEKRGGWKTSRMTPLPKRGFGPPLVRYVFHPPQVSVLCFSCTKIHDRADQKLFWRGPKIFGRARSLVRDPPPYVLHPPISRHPDKHPAERVGSFLPGGRCSTKGCRVPTWKSWGSALRLCPGAVLSRMLLPFET